MRSGQPPQDAADESGRSQTRGGGVSGAAVVECGAARGPAIMATCSDLGTSLESASGVLKVTEQEDATAVQHSAPVGTSQSGFGAGSDVVS
jgi:hypothetical protein